MKYLIVFIILIGCCFARIGETKAECEKRYGKPWKTMAKSKMDIFKFKTLFIGVKYLNGTCQQIIYRKQEVDVLDRPKKLSENEIELILKANSNEKWTPIASSFLTKTWTNNDNLTAQTSASGLVITTQAAQDKEDTDKKDKEKKELDGL